MASSPPPSGVLLLLFDSYVRRDAFCDATALSPLRDALASVHCATRVEPYVCGEQNVFHLAVPRARTTPEYALKVSTLATMTRAARVYVFNDALATSATTDGAHIVFLNASRASLARVARELHLDMVQGSDAVNACVARAFPAPSPSFLPHRIVFRNDNDFALAARESLRTYELERAARKPPSPVPLQADWTHVLRDHADPVEPGRPMCIVCYDKQASVCFVSCSHQVCCDECVRIIWTRADVAHRCPACKKACNQIVRPIVSATADDPMEMSPERPSKKMCK